MYCRFILRPHTVLGLLMVFVAVAFTLALLEGAGLVISYVHFQNVNTRMAVLESHVLGMQSGVSTLEVSSTDGSPGESPGMQEVLRVHANLFVPKGAHMHRLASKVT